jgi:hypothetical protein
LAERAVNEGGSTTDERAAWMFRMATSRPPDAKELAELTAAYRDLLAGYRQDAEGVKKLIAVRESRLGVGIEQAELAAYTMVANLILNLDEVLTKG